MEPEYGYEMTPLADRFEEYIRGLVDEEALETQNR